MLIKSAVFLAILSACLGFERDENYYINENDTIVNLFLKTMDLSDYKIPPADNLDYMNHVGRKVFDMLPPLNLTGNRMSSECRKASNEFLNSLLNFELWALKMYDASGKLTSGILNGNVNQYGDFDQCLETVAKSNNFKSQYCLAYIQPKISPNFQYLNYLRTLSLSFEAYKSKFEDPRHVIPKTSQIHWGLCVPSACSPKEVEIVIAENLKKFFDSSNLEFDVQVREDMCQMKEEQQAYDVGTQIAIGIVVLLLIVTAISTLYEKPGTANQNEWLTAFSLKKNFKDLTTSEPSKGDIPSPHGIRFINTVMLIISHKCMELDFNPIPNRTAMVLTSKSPMTVIVRASYLYTDTFIMLSGMLVAYSFVGRLQRGQTINTLKEIAARYFRVVPPMAGLILFGTFLLPLLGSGPQWPMLITYQSQLCRQNWWRNFLMIHNWFGFENICMTHTHHVGTDFGLFLSAPFIIPFLYKSPRRASVAIFLFALVSTIARFYTTYAYDTTVYVLFGLDINKLYDIASHMYILPPYRFTVYSMGIVLGYLLRTRKGTRLTKNQLNLGWLIATVGILGTLFMSSLMSVYNYKFNLLHAAFYSSIAPIPWCFFFAWIIYTSQLGYKNWFVKLLEWKGFTISTKLAYGIYLVQFAVFHYNISTVRSSAHFGLIKSVFNMNELLWIVFASSILTLLFDYPFSNLKKLIFDSKKTVVADEKSTLDINSNVVKDDKKDE